MTSILFFGGLVWRDSQKLHCIHHAEISHSQVSSDRSPKDSQFWKASSNLPRQKTSHTLQQTNIAMQNPPFWWYLSGKMRIFHGYVSLPKRINTIWSKLNLKPFFHLPRKLWKSGSSWDQRMRPVRIFGIRKWPRHGRDAGKTLGGWSNERNLGLWR